VETFEDSHFSSSSAEDVGSNWSQERRLKFIDFRLRWDGKINRTDLKDFFRISLPQASADLARYTDLAKDNLAYDPRQKCYVKTESFRPVFSRANSRTYLNELLAVSTGLIDKRSSYVGWMPELGVAAVPSRGFDGGTLTRLVEAIRDKRTAFVNYQSMDRPEPTERQLSPTALASDGLRWHLRAFCHMRNDFRDFVIGRISEVKLDGPSSLTAADDRQWSRELTLVLAPHPSLSEARRRAIETDYDMVDGKTTFTCRHALLFYTLRRLRLDEPEQLDRPAAEQIILQNRSQLQPFIDALHERARP
jgi:hypothetical protein